MKNRTTLLLCCALAALLVLCGCSASAHGDSPDTSPSQSASSSGAESTPPDGSPAPDPGAAGSSDAAPDASLSPQPDGSGQAAKSSAYDFSSPVPERDPVDNSYFQDAAFIGDSRTDGFLIYSGIGCGENLTSNGLSIFKLDTKKAITIDGESYTIPEALGRKQYGKVYLSLGVNELGYYDDKGFYEAYCKAVDTIRACQPNAVIYIQGLIPLNESVIASTGGPSYLTNEHLLVYNDLMKQVAQEKQVAFLDLNPAFAGPDGQLPADASRDGVHLTKAYCEKWLDYLKTHTVDYDTLYPAQS